MPIKFRTIPIKEPYTIDSIGNHWNQETVQRPTGHPFFHYLQTEKGSGRMLIQGKKYTLKPGEGVLIAPFIPHSYHSESNEWITSFVTLTGTIESSIINMVGNRSVIFLQKEQTTEISTLINDMVNAFDHPPLDTRMLSVNCYRLLLHFAEGINTKDLFDTPLYQKYVAPVVKEMETHYDQDLTVQELSNQVYVTPQYLSRLFRRFLGCSVYDYLTTYRISKAKELLLVDSQLKVQDIAQRVGFPDPSHFIFIFRKITGFTPLEFRKQN